MATELSTTNKNINILLAKLKEDLTAFPEGMNSLEIELESSSKHLPAYLKIVKTHIDQLAKVLGTDNHYNRKIETTPLAEPVKQLITLFRVLEDQDLQILEELAKATKNWQPETDSKQTTVDELTIKNPTAAIQI
jgi:hypothetical protein